MHSKTSTPGFVALMASAMMGPVAIGEESARGLAALHVAENFSVEQVAGPPLTKRPMMGGFDDRGRLYLAESAGENLEAKDLLSKTPNFIRRLTDDDGDGTFDASTVFADQMTFPMGALWYRGSIYSASPPYIWKLTDRDDDGVADQRDILVGQFGFIGNAADVHGCFLSPGGRIYWCDGRHGHEFVDEKGNVLSKGKAARIFSCRPDGTDVRWHAGGGMDNPVEVDFLPEGPTLGVVNLFYNKRGDCLVHWLHGGVYPRDDMPLQLAEFHRTGDLLGPVHDFGHVAVSGCIRYQGQSLGADLEGCWFVCQFNTHKIVKVTLASNGSSYSATSEDFLVSDDPDFHPTDVIEDADGSLIVVDTGGWFRNGCPTSQLAKPDITGGLYRIRRRDAEKIEDPRGQSLPWDQATDDDLMKRLDDPRPAVREKATDLLAQRIESAGADASIATALSAHFSQAKRERKQTIIWTGIRAGLPVPRAAWNDADESVRLTAASAAQDRPLREYQADLVRLLAQDPSPAVRREAATTLGILRAPVVGELLHAVPSAIDRSLEHAIIYALIEIGDWEATREGLSDEQSTVRRAALIALDQMDPSRLSRDLVAPLLDTSDQQLLQTTLEVIGKRSGWSEEILGLAEPWLARPSLTEAEVSMLRGVLVSFENDAHVQTIVGAALANRTTAESTRRLLLDVIAQSQLAPVPASWAEGVGSAITATDPATRRSALGAAGRVVEQVTDQLRQVVGDEREADAHRSIAARLLASSMAPPDDATWSVLLKSLDSADAVERWGAADAVGSANLSPEQLSDLVPHLIEAGPVELASMLRAFERSTASHDWAESFVRAVQGARSRTTIATTRWERIAGELPEASHGLKAVIEESRAIRGQHLEKVDAIVGLVATADADRGAKLFASARTSCAGCHRIAGQGGQIGPDLSTIGASRTARDLAESIIMPSASLARGYESLRVVTEDGVVIVGVVARESVDALWLRTQERGEVRIHRAEIDESAPSTQSIMPDGLDNALSPGELADLVRFLMDRR